MKILVSFLLRLFALAFNLALAVFLFGVGFIGSLQGEQIHFELVPGIDPEYMSLTLMGLGVFGLFSILLAWVRSKLARLPMLLWNLLVCSLLICAFARPSYRFDGIEHLQQGAILFVLSLFALVGSWLVLRAARSPAA